MPERQPETGPIDHLIPVTFDPSTLALTLEFASVAVRPGDRVLWRFHGVPPGWSPWIEFRTGTGAGFAGPFSSLTQGATEVWGPLAAELPTGLIPYRAVLQQGFGGSKGRPVAMVASAESTLSVHPPERGASLIFDVALDPNGGVPILVVTPETQALDTLDVVEWRFHGIPGEPGEYRPRVDFLFYDGDQTEPPNRRLGPFTSLTYDDAGVRGTGNVGVQGHYHFEVMIVRVVTGEAVWISSGDPVVDNRGSVGP